MTINLFNKATQHLIIQGKIIIEGSIEIMRTEDIITVIDIIVNQVGLKVLRDGLINQIMMISTILHIILEVTVVQITEVIMILIKVIHLHLEDGNMTLFKILIVKCTLVT